MNYYQESASAPTIPVGLGGERQLNKWDKNSVVKEYKRKIELLNKFFKGNKING